MHASTERDTFDTTRLAAYLQASISGFRGPLSVQKFAGGQSNPTFLLESPSGKYVLRREPPGEVLKSAHAVDREFRVIAALAATEVPVARAIHLCSDDEVIGSMIFHPDEAAVSALIDWELSTLGHPMADLAYHCMSMRLPGLSDMQGLGGKDRAKLNIPSEEDFIARYCERTGMGRIDHWPFYLAFSYFRLAAIVQGVMKRALDGNASSKKALDVGKMARPLAEMAVAVLESSSSASLGS